MREGFAAIYGDVEERLRLGFAAEAAVADGRRRALGRGARGAGGGAAGAGRGHRHREGLHPRPRRREGTHGHVLCAGGFCLRRRGRGGRLREAAVSQLLFTHGRHWVF